MAKVGDVTLRIAVVDPKVVPDTTFTYVDIGSIDNRSNRIVDPKSLRGRDAPSRARQLLQAGDTVFSTVRTYLRNIGFVDASLSGAIGSTGFSVLRPAAGIHPRLLHYYARTKAFVDGLSVQMRGTSYPAVVDSQVRDMEIPLPPTAEQERIVAAIDEQFSRLDAGVDQLERAKLNLERMRAAVHLRFDKAASVGISPQPLAAHAEFIVDGDHNPPKRFAQGIPYLTAKHVKNGHVTTENSTFVSPDDFETLRRRYDPHPGDVLVTCVGTLGEVAVVPKGLTFAADRNIAAIRPTRGVNPAFLASLLRSPRHQKILAAGSGSTAQPHLYLKDLRALAVAVPGSGRQAALVDQLDSELELIGHAEKVANTSLGRVGLLRSAILTAAFSGKLVPQDPNDEPAFVLLERIANGNRTDHNSRQTRPGEPT